ncbi:PAS domain-containing protein [Novosphingobium sp. KACC 22771]|uniref:PAS domain-containing protein n=1 Tax=Novosphingobium sp. KACC 22771 TaxID=3025670 RepID=UPI0023666777|nr:PAS domain-containing protein [Novosphingobium sp. KACC 22771]WDF73098.1 PAS domain-containing protein [Novosphingobium sp. KACC 22771]
MRALSTAEREAYITDLGQVGRDVRDKLDGLARAASHICDTPVALVSLVGREEQAFLGRQGYDGPEPPSAVSFCQHAMLGEAAMIVPDATLDPRFAENPLVTGDMGIRFYAGHPLRNKQGMPLGSLCVIDTVPKAGLSPGQLDDLSNLADAAMLYLENWSEKRVHGEINAQAQRDMDVMTRRFITLADALPQLVWSTPPDGMSDYFSKQWVEFTGAPASDSFGFGWINFLHPDDVELTREAWRRSVMTSQPYQIEYRVRRHDGEYIWMLARGIPVLDAEGQVARWIGTCTDINDRVATGEALEIMSRELSHRIKNLFSVVQSLVTMGLRQFPEMGEVSRALQSRMVALGRAHDLVRPRVVDGRPSSSQTMLRELAEYLIEPFQPEGEPRVFIKGEDAMVGDSSATPIALFLHEMLTNSVKYGALGAPGGRIALTIAQQDDAVLIEWHESGGPAIAEAPAPGFGTRLIQMTIERQLSGTITRQWQDGGLLLQARIPLVQLSAH